MLICLRIETNESIDHISNILGVKPTDFILKGESKSKALSPSEKNIWMYDKKIKDCKEIGENIFLFFEKLPNIFEKIEAIKKVGMISIRLSVISDFAQIGFDLSERDINIINRLGVPIEISFFSWGGCIDE